MRVRTALAFGICLITAPVLAEAPPAPYPGQQTRAIKALSDEDIAALLKGEGMGFAKAAELNGYPGPRHVLDLGAQLKLTPDQRQRAQAIFDRMSAAAKPFGAELVERERALDQLFQKGGISPDHLTTETARIAELQGRLRSVHLSAHLETRALLTADQIAMYQHLRGYGGQVAPMQHRHHG
jgi:Spy/CpxP family protein refolding chaperone